MLYIINLYVFYKNMTKITNRDFLETRIFQKNHFFPDFLRFGPRALGWLHHKTHIKMWAKNPQKLKKAIFGKKGTFWYIVLKTGFFGSFLPGIFSKKRG
jgi:hypothetical protein